MKQPYNFKKGEVYKMDVAERSSVKHPYYVIIKDVGIDFIVTDIPGKHSLKITKGNNWDYHTPRMTFIGSDKLSKELIYNQKNLIPE